MLFPLAPCKWSLGRRHYRCERLATLAPVVLLALFGVDTAVAASPLLELPRHAQPVAPHPQADTSRLGLVGGLGSSRLMRRQDSATTSADVPAGSVGGGSHLVGVNADGASASLIEVDGERAGRGVLVPGLGLHRDGQGYTLAELAARHQEPEHKAPLLYSLKGGLSDMYCSDSGPEPVKCDQRAVGIYESFQIFHWSRAPSLHVLQGGQFHKYCRDHGDHVSCNHDTISSTEEFYLSSLGEYKVIKGHERDSYCSVKSDTILACADKKIDDAAGAFKLTLLPRSAPHK